MATMIDHYQHGAPPLSLTYVNSAIGASKTRALPVGAAAGDLVLMMEWVSGGAALGSITGWNSFAVETTQANYHARFSYRVLQSGDTGITTGSTGSEFVTGMFVYRPSKPIIGLSASTINKEGTTANPTPQTVAAASAPFVPLIVLGLAGSNGNSFSFSTASPAWDYDLSADPGNTFCRMASKLYNASPADHTIDMTDQGANVLMSCYMMVF